MNRKGLIILGAAGLMSIVIGTLIFLRVVPTAKTIFDLQINTVVGGLFMLAGLFCLGNAIANWLGK